MRKTNPTRLSDADIKAIKIEIARLKINVADTFKKFSPLKLKTLFKNELLVYSKIVNDKALSARISYVKKERGEADDVLFSAIKDNYIIFAMTLNI